MKCTVLIALLVIASAPEPAQVIVPYERPRHRDAILVSARVNGRNATLLLDTGAVHTVVSAEIMGVGPVQLRESRFLGGPGLRGEAVWEQADLQIGSHRWRARPVAVMKLSEVSQVYGRRIDGLLGLDLLNEFERVVIDHRGRRIIFERQSTESAADACGRAVC